jgi:hypothetical protein
VFCHSVLEQGFELNGTFRMLNAPALLDEMDQASGSSGKS